MTTYIHPTPSSNNQVLNSKKFDPDPIPELTPLMVNSTPNHNPNDDSELESMLVQLHYSIMSHSPQLESQLLKFGKNHELHNSNKSTHTNPIPFSYNHDINTILPDKFGSMTLLSHACLVGNSHAVNLLITQYHADLEYSLHDTWLTPLNLTCTLVLTKETLEIIIILLKNGADLNSHDIHNRTPLYNVFASTFDHNQQYSQLHIDALEAFVKYGCSWLPLSIILSDFNQKHTNVYFTLLEAILTEKNFINNPNFYQNIYESFLSLFRNPSLTSDLLKRLILINPVLFRRLSIQLEEYNSSLQAKSISSNRQQELFSLISTQNTEILLPHIYPVHHTPLSYLLRYATPITNDTFEIVKMFNNVSDYFPLDVKFDWMETERVKYATARVYKAKLEFVLQKHEKYISEIQKKIQLENNPNGEKSGEKSGEQISITLHDDLVAINTAIIAINQQLLQLKNTSQHATFSEQDELFEAYNDVCMGCEECNKNRTNLIQIMVLEENESIGKKENNSNKNADFLPFFELEQNFNFSSIGSETLYICQNCPTCSSRWKTQDNIDEYYTEHIPLLHQSETDGKHSSSPLQGLITYNSLQPDPKPIFSIIDYIFHHCLHLNVKNLIRKHASALISTLMISPVPNFDILYYLITTTGGLLPPTQLPTLRLPQPLDLTSKPIQQGPYGMPPPGPIAPNPLAPYDGPQVLAMAANGGANDDGEDNVVDLNEMTIYFEYNTNPLTMVLTHYSGIVHNPHVYLNELHQIQQEKILIDCKVWDKIDKSGNDWGNNTKNKQILSQNEKILTELLQKPHELPLGYLLPPPEWHLVRILAYFIQNSDLKKIETIIPSALLNAKPTSLSPQALPHYLLSGVSIPLLAPKTNQDLLKEDIVTQGMSQIYKLMPNRTKLGFFSRIFSSANKEKIKSELTRLLPEGTPLSYGLEDDDEGLEMLMLLNDGEQASIASFLALSSRKGAKVSPPICKHCRAVYDYVYHYNKALDRLEIAKQHEQFGQDSSSYAQTQQHSSHPSHNTLQLHNTSSNSRAVASDVSTDVIDVCTKCGGNDWVFHGSGKKVNPTAMRNALLQSYQSNDGDLVETFKTLKDDFDSDNFDNINPGNTCKNRHNIAKCQNKEQTEALIGKNLLTHQTKSIVNKILDAQINNQFNLIFLLIQKTTLTPISMYTILDLLAKNTNFDQILANVYKTPIHIVPNFDNISTAICTTSTPIHSTLNGSTFLIKQAQIRPKLPTLNPYEWMRHGNTASQLSAVNISELGGGDSDPNMHKIAGGGNFGDALDQNDVSINRDSISNHKQTMTAATRTNITSGTMNSSRSAEGGNGGADNAGLGANGSYSNPPQMNSTNITKAFVPTMETIVCEDNKGKNGDDDEKGDSSPSPENSVSSYPEVIDVDWIHSIEIDPVVDSANKVKFATYLTQKKKKINKKAALSARVALSSLCLPPALSLFTQEFPKHVFTIYGDKRKPSQITPLYHEQGLVYPEQQLYMHISQRLLTIFKWVDVNKIDFESSFLKKPLYREASTILDFFSSDQCETLFLSTRKYLQSSHPELRRFKQLGFSPDAFLGVIDGNGYEDFKKGIDVFAADGTAVSRPNGGCDETITIDINDHHNDGITMTNSSSQHLPSSVEHSLNSQSASGTKTDESGPVLTQTNTNISTSLFAHTHVVSSVHLPQSLTHVINDYVQTQPLREANLGIIQGVHHLRNYLRHKQLSSPLMNEPKQIQNQFFTWLLFSKYSFSSPFSNGILKWWLTHAMRLLKYSSVNFPIFTRLLYSWLQEVNPITAPFQLSLMRILYDNPIASQSFWTAPAIQMFDTQAKDVAKDYMKHCKGSVCVQFMGKDDMPGDNCNNDAILGKNSQMNASKSLDRNSGQNPEENSNSIDKTTPLSSQTRPPLQMNQKMRPLTRYYAYSMVPVMLALINRDHRKLASISSREKQQYLYEKQVSKTWKSSVTIARANRRRNSTLHNSKSNLNYEHDKSFSNLNLATPKQFDNTKLSIKSTPSTHKLSSDYYLQQFSSPTQSHSTVETFQGTPAQTNLGERSSSSGSLDFDGKPPSLSLLAELEQSKFDILGLHVGIQQLRMLSYSRNHQVLRSHSMRRYVNRELKYSQAMFPTPLQLDYQLHYTHKAATIQKLNLASRNQSKEIDREIEQHGLGDVQHEEGDELLDLPHRPNQQRGILGLGGNASTGHAVVAGGGLKNCGNVTQPVINPVIASLIQFPSILQPHQRFIWQPTGPPKGIFFKEQYDPFKYIKHKRTPFSIYSSEYFSLLIFNSGTVLCTVPKGKEVVEVVPYPDEQEAENREERDQPCEDMIKYNQVEALQRMELTQNTIKTDKSGSDGKKPPDCIVVGNHLHNVIANQPIIVPKQRIHFDDEVAGLGADYNSDEKDDGYLSEQVSHEDGFDNDDDDDGEDHSFDSDEDREFDSQSDSVYRASPSIGADGNYHKSVIPRGSHFNEARNKKGGTKTLFLSKIICEASFQKITPEFYEIVNVFLFNPYTHETLAQWFESSLLSAFLTLCSDFNEFTVAIVDLFLTFPDRFFYLDQNSPNSSFYWLTDDSLQAHAMKAFSSSLYVNEFSSHKPQSNLGMNPSSPSSAFTPSTDWANNAQLQPQSQPQSQSNQSNVGNLAANKPSIRITSSNCSSNDAPGLEQQFSLPSQLSSSHDHLKRPTSSLAGQTFVGSTVGTQEVTDADSVHYHSQLQVLGAHVSFLQNYGLQQYQHLGQRWDYGSAYNGFGKLTCGDFSEENEGDVVSYYRPRGQPHPSTFQSLSSTQLSLSQSAPQYNTASRSNCGNQIDASDYYYQKYQTKHLMENQALGFNSYYVINMELQKSIGENVSSQYSSAISKNPHLQSHQKSQQEAPLSLHQKKLLAMRGLVAICGRQDIPSTIFHVRIITKLLNYIITMDNMILKEESASSLITAHNIPHSNSTGHHNNHFDPPSPHINNNSNIITPLTTLSSAASDYTSKGKFSDVKLSENNDYMVYDMANGNVTNTPVFSVDSSPVVDSDNTQLIVPKSQPEPRGLRRQPKSHTSLATLVESPNNNKINNSVDYLDDESNIHTTQPHSNQSMVTVMGKSSPQPHIVDFSQKSKTLPRLHHHSRQSSRQTSPARSTAAQHAAQHAELKTTKPQQKTSYTTTFSNQKHVMALKRHQRYLYRIERSVQRELSTITVPYLLSQLFSAVAPYNHYTTAIVELLIKYQYYYDYIPQRAEQWRLHLKLGYNRNREFMRISNHPFLLFGQNVSQKVTTVCKRLTQMILFPHMSIPGLENSLLSPQVYNPSTDGDQFSIGDIVRPQENLLVDRLHRRYTIILPRNNKTVAFGYHDVELYEANIPDASKLRQIGMQFLDPDASFQDNLEKFEQNFNKNQPTKQQQRVNLIILNPSNNRPHSNSHNNTPPSTNQIDMQALDSIPTTPSVSIHSNESGGSHHKPHVDSTKNLQLLSLLFCHHEAFSTTLRFRLPWLTSSIVMPNIAAIQEMRNVDNGDGENHSNQNDQGQNNRPPQHQTTWLESEHPDVKRGVLTLDNPEDHIPGYNNSNTNGENVQDAVAQQLTFRQKQTQLGDRIIVLEELDVIFILKSNKKQLEREFRSQIAKNDQLWKTIDIDMIMGFFTRYQRGSIAMIDPVLVKKYIDQPERLLRKYYKVLINEQNKDLVNHGNNEEDPDKAAAVCDKLCREFVSRHITTVPVPPIAYEVIALLAEFQQTSLVYSRPHFKH